MANRITIGETGQTLRHVPLGVVSDASFVFEDLHYAPGHELRIIAEDDITPPSWSLTSTAVAGVTQRNGARISANPTTGATIGAHAVIVAPDGSSEPFKIAALSTNSYIEATSTLSGEYPAGSTVHGVDLAVSVPDGAAAETRLAHALRVTWTYTLDGRVHRIPESVELVRHNVPADMLIGEAVQWISDAYDDLKERRAGLDRKAKLMVVEVANDLRSRSIDPATFMTGDNARALLVARVLAHLGETGYSPGNTNQVEWAARMAKLYGDRLDNLTIGVAGHGTAVTDVRTDRSPETPDRTSRSLFAAM